MVHPGGRAGGASQVITSFQISLSMPMARHPETHHIRALLREGLLTPRIAPGMALLRPTASHKHNPPAWCHRALGLFPFRLGGAGVSPSKGYGCAIQPNLLAGGLILES